MSPPTPRTRGRVWIDTPPSWNISPGPSPPPPPLLQRPTRYKIRPEQTCPQDGEGDGTPAREECSSVPVRVGGGIYVGGVKPSFGLKGSIICCCLPLIPSAREPERPAGADTGPAAGGTRVRRPSPRPAAGHIRPRRDLAANFGPLIINKSRNFP